jgi:UDP-N-acetyl-D-mannosaminuronic acid dehydrogenase
MEYSIKTACVVGLGYIGLPTAATLAGRGVDVIGVDINPDVVEAVNAGQPYFPEPDLDMLLRAETTLRKLRATPGPEPADAFVIAVPTPFNPDRSPNLDYIYAAADAIAPALACGNIVILVTGWRAAGSRRDWCPARSEPSGLSRSSPRARSKGERPSRPK